ncbi:3-methyladenine DNA glycosylase [Nocardia alni]|uniref:3-methyladenine DNA glycosylase n=1 Tax=Nocardia alni TaxID=2815723 RepID=UPI003F682877
MRLLPEHEWRALAAAHCARVDGLIGPYLEHRAAGSKHPVIDFLFTYYGHKPAQLRRWHPGYGVALENAREYDGARGYHRHSVASVRPPAVMPERWWRDSTASAPELAGSGHSHAGMTEAHAEAAAPDIRTWTADPAYLARRADTVGYVADLLRATASRPAQLSCFGLHEWAMVYRSEEVRHQQVPLRLGHEGTDSVVESMSLRCTHFDAFRFFTPDAVPRNAEPLTRESQLQREQPACLHANMDLYKWAFKLVPLVDSALLLDCFELACAARELDMRASPYDLTEYGYTPVRIETPAGRAEYVRNQADLADRAADLRTRLHTACQDLLALIPADTAREGHPSIRFEEARRVDSGGSR